MTIPERIDQIIAIRHEQAERVKQEAEHLDSVRQAMYDFQSLRNVVAQSGNEELAEKLNSIVVDRFITDCDNVMKELNRLQTRFSRNHVHMSFVGRARQGKSLVMQQISGLEGDIIPSSDGGHCTGAKSIITNLDTQSVVADIQFYRADEVVSIVNDYLKGIFGEMEPQIRQVSEIPGLSRRNLQEKLDPKNAAANSHWEHLQKYIEHIGEFEAYLGEGERKTITVSADEIESYVAQYKNDNPDELYYKYLGVKEADIHCRFPAYEICGKLVLVDTIGLGDTSIGVEEEMIRAIREDSDAILYMFRPDVKGPIIDKDHYEIIEDIASKVSVEYARKMLFWVVNRDMSNGEQKGRQISNLANKIEDARKHNVVPICQVLDVNCMDSNEVQGRLLTPVLEQMSDNLEAIDSLLIERVQSQLNRLYDTYQVLSTQIQNAHSKTVSQDVRRKLEDSIDGTFSRWTNELRKLCRDRKSQRDIDNSRFSGEFQKKLKQIYTRLPSPEVIESYLSRMLGHYSRHDVYIRITQYLRVRIINDFLTLDDTLNQLVLELKTEIAHILADENKGRLGFIIPFSDGDNPDEWFDALAQVAESGGYDSICEAFQSLRDFGMSVTGFFIYPVRNGLDLLDPELQESLAPIEGDNEKDMSRSIYGWLKRYIFQIHSKIEKDCRQYLSFPNSALYAAARDFWDRSSFAVPSLEKESVEIQKKWKHFYEDHITEIWPDECNQYTAVSQMNENFGTLVKVLKDRSRKNYFQV